MGDILIKDFPMDLNGHWGTFSEHIVIHGDGSITDVKGRHIGSAKAMQVVHAHWIRHENADVFEGYEVPMFECSKCKTWKEDDSNYCPDCGAIMDA